jgi:hypothetical protein
MSNLIHMNNSGEVLYINRIPSDDNYHTLILCANDAILTNK